jgi:hypothetical protein
MGPPPLSNTLQMIRASEYGRSEHSPDRIRQPSQIRREATGRPKVPCPPKSSFCRRGLMRFFSSPDRETGNTGLLCPGPRRIQSPLDSTPEGHRDSVNRRVRTVPFLLNLWDSPTTIGDWPDLQAGDTRPGPGSSLSQGTENFSSTQNPQVPSGLSNFRLGHFHIGEKPWALSFENRNNPTPCRVPSDLFRLQSSSEAGSCPPSVL